MDIPSVSVGSREPHGPGGSSEQEEEIELVGEERTGAPEDPASHREASAGGEVEDQEDGRTGEADIMHEEEDSRESRR